jgi:hypothetical protein
MMLMRCRGFALLGAALACAGAPATAAAQRVSGRVLRPGGEHPPPVPGAWVVLHRIGHDTAGPVDSVRTNARGEYTFTYSRPEDDSSLYLASSVRGGVAYFTAPLRAGDVRGEPAEIMVFDTTSKKVPLHIQGRHLVVARGTGDTNHEVLEVYELSNDTVVTAVAPKNGAVWTALVPEHASKFRLGDGDVSAGGLVMRDGRVHLFAPIAPGLKQLSFHYELPVNAVPLRVPITEPVGVLEVMIDDPGARVTGAGLREMPRVESEGRKFKRFLSQDVPRNAVVKLELSPETGETGSTRGATVVGLGALFAATAGGALALASVRARKRQTSVRSTPQSQSEVLIRSIAELDARFERDPVEVGPRRVEYEAERQVLKERLREALARDPSRT